MCGRSAGIVHLFWVLTVEGSGYFVRYCGVLMEYRERVNVGYVLMEMYTEWKLSMGAKWGWKC